MLKLVLSTDPLALTKDEKELAYLLEKLGKLEGADVTGENWQDFYESWASFLSLRSRLEAQCAQQIFDAIATDEAVFAGLGAARLLKDAVITSGKWPNELLLQLKQGPGKHAKNRACTTKPHSNSARAPRSPRRACHRPLLPRPCLRPRPPSVPRGQSPAIEQPWRGPGVRH